MIISRCSLMTGKTRPEMSVRPIGGYRLTRVFFGSYQCRRCHARLGLGDQSTGSIGTGSAVLRSNPSIAIMMMLGSDVSHSLLGTCSCEFKSSMAVTPYLSPRLPPLPRVHGGANKHRGFYRDCLTIFSPLTSHPTTPTHYKIQCIYINKTKL